MSIKMSILAMHILRKISGKINYGRGRIAKNFMTAALLAFCLVTSSFASNYLLGDFAFADVKKETKGSAKKFYQKARAKIEQGHYVEGIEELKKALAVDKKNADVWSLYGFAARKAGSLQVAEQAYDQALALNPDHLGALEYSGELYIEQARFDKAQERLSRLQALCSQGCKELTMLKQALQAKAVGVDTSHKAPKLQW